MGSTDGQEQKLRTSERETAWEELKQMHNDNVDSAIKVRLMCMRRMEGTGGRKEGSGESEGEEKAGS